MLYGENINLNIIFFDTVQLHLSTAVDLTLHVVLNLGKSTRVRYGYCTYSKGNPITGFWYPSLVYHYWTLSRIFLEYR